MIEKLSQAILTFLIKNDAVADENQAIVRFGIEQGLRSGIEVAIMLITGAAMHLFWQSAVILLSFIPIRIYAGGYHADTPLQCAIKSWALLMAVLLWLKYVPANLILQVAVLAATAIWILCFAPMEDIHKPLREKEKKKYRSRAIRNDIIAIGVFVIGYVMNRENVSRCIALGNIMLLVIFVAGSIKNRKRDR